MEIPDWFVDKDFEQRILLLEQRINALEYEVNNLKSKLSSHYIE